jgi:hypothetical protein
MRTRNGTKKIDAKEQYINTLGKSLTDVYGIYYSRRTSWGMFNAYDNLFYPQVVNLNLTLDCISPL